MMDSLFLWASAERARILLMVRPLLPVLLRSWLECVFFIPSQHLLLSPVPARHVLVCLDPLCSLLSFAVRLGRISPSTTRPRNGIKDAHNSRESQYGNALSVLALVPFGYSPISCSYPAPGQPPSAARHQSPETPQSNLKHSLIVSFQRVLVSTFKDPQRHYSPWPRHG